MVILILIILLIISFFVMSGGKRKPSRNAVDFIINSLFPTTREVIGGLMFVIVLAILLWELIPIIFHFLVEHIHIT